MATTSSSKFSSTLDEALMDAIKESSEVLGMKKPASVKAGPKVWDIPEGYAPVDTVIPLPRIFSVTIAESRMQSIAKKKTVILS